ncbi:MAG: glycoside hydrolase family 97 N-terminal domain-containing protein [Cyclobacteriaceae bacterium]
MLVRNFIPSVSYPLLVSLIFCFSSCSESKNEQTVQVVSPNQTYVFNFHPSVQDSATYYTITYQDQSVIGKSELGFRLANSTIIGKHVRVTKQETREVNQQWEPVYGEKNEYPDVYHETLLSLEDDNIAFQLRVRAYNEGVAFRYEFANDVVSAVQSELTEFSLPSDAVTWSSLRAQSEIRKMPLSQLSDSMAVERPLLIQLSDTLFTAIGEAGLVEYARMKLLPKAGVPGTLVASLSSEVKTEQSWQTPWRFVMAGHTAGQILENNYLLLNLNEPNKIEDTSWIKPGKVIRESTLTTDGGIACVDFAVEHHLQFIEFDAGWYGNEYDSASDATTVTVDPKRSPGPLDLQKVIDYGKSKGIGVILYVNQRALEKQLDEVLPLTQSWGVQGLKYGFVNVGSQEWTHWLHEAVRKAADHQLMVDIHDEYRPTGYSRTYPNLMTQEGIRGDEESPKNAMVLNTIFTRMIAGAGDHTNCYFAERVDEQMGSHASQLAKAVCIYSPWQFLYWYDRPQKAPGEKGGAGNSKNFIQEVPELAFYDSLPTVWDDTRVLDGYPGEYAVIARKHGETWFMGALNGEQARDFSIPLTFLEPDQSYEATLFLDDAQSSGPTHVAVEKRTVTSQDIIKQPILASNGIAVMFRPTP